MKPIKPIPWRTRQRISMQHEILMSVASMADQLIRSAGYRPDAAAQVEAQYSACQSAQVLSLEEMFLRSAGYRPEPPEAEPQDFSPIPPKPPCPVAAQFEAAHKAMRETPLNDHRCAQPIGDFEMDENRVHEVAMYAVRVVGEAFVYSPSDEPKPEPLERARLCVEAYCAAQKRLTEGSASDTQVAEVAGA